MSIKGDIDEELNKLPIESVNDRVSRLDLEITENTVVDKPHIEEVKSAKPEVVTKVSSQPREKEKCESSIAKGQAELKTSATVDPSVQASKIDLLFEKMSPAFVKIVKPNVPKFNGNPLEYSQFKAAFNSCGYTRLRPKVTQWVIALGWDRFGFPARSSSPVTL